MIGGIFTSYSIFLFYLYFCFIYWTSVVSDLHPSAVFFWAAPCFPTRCRKSRWEESVLIFLIVSTDDPLRRDNSRWFAARRDGSDPGLGAVWCRQVSRKSFLITSCVWTQRKQRFASKETQKTMKGPHSNRLSWCLPPRGLAGSR